MRKRWFVVSLLLLSTLSILAGCSRKEAPGSRAPAATPSGTAGETAPSGEALFKQYCSSCHPDGGNVSDPGRSLHGSALKKNRITTPDDIIKVMRTPISRMIRFDPSTLSDRDARAIAEYILATYK